MALTFASDVPTMGNGLSNVVCPMDSKLLLLQAAACEELPLTALANPSVHRSVLPQDSGILSAYTEAVIIFAWDSVMLCRSQVP